MTCQGCNAPLHGMPLTGHAPADKKHSSELKIVVTTICLRLTFIVTYQSFYIFYLSVTSLTNVQEKHKQTQKIVYSLHITCDKYSRFNIVIKI